MVDGGVNLFGSHLSYIIYMQSLHYVDLLVEIRAETELLKRAHMCRRERGRN